MNIAKQAIYGGNSTYINKLMCEEELHLARRIECNKATNNYESLCKRNETQLIFLLNYSSKLVKCLNSTVGTGM